MTDLQKDRLFELLEDEIFFGLRAEDKVELESLQKQFPDWKKDFSLELTATAISLSNLDASEELPASLQTRILANADDFFQSFSAAKQNSPSVNFTPQINSAINQSAASNVVETAPSRPFWQWLGWAFAAAACVALAINLWTTRSSERQVVQNTPPVNSPTPKLSPEQARARLLDNTADTVKISLADPKNAKEILGEMNWSESLQKGYLRFNNLPVNDIAKETYQLWIVDEAQNPKTPISGGVFDVSKTGEVIIPVDPQLVVKKPLAIAVTVEKPGGVVVSTQEKVVALAKI